MGKVIYLAIGLLTGIALTFPRTTPEARYYVEGDRRIVHWDRDCAYSDLYTFATLSEARNANLTPCPVCVSPRLRQKVAQRYDREGDSEAQKDVVPVSTHAPLPGEYISSHSLPASASRVPRLED